VTTVIRIRYIKLNIIVIFSCGTLSFKDDCEFRDFLFIILIRLISYGRDRPLLKTACIVFMHGLFHSNVCFTRLHNYNDKVLNKTTAVCGYVWHCNCEVADVMYTISSGVFPYISPPFFSEQGGGPNLL